MNIVPGRVTVAIIRNGIQGHGCLTATFKIFYATIMAHENS